MEDAVLVGGLLAGEKSSFDHIYEKYSPELYRTAYLILRNKTDAEDATQDAFVTLWQKAGSIKKPESLRYWLLKCVSGKSKDILRKRRKEYPDEDIINLSETHSGAK
ncbi:MAG: RNA polymerase sigma factor [Lachnospiraceae bacterium]|nr:RNA polymerase sigma factor [Lachnospiraceae bacterium]